MTHKLIDWKIKQTLRIENNKNVTPCSNLGMMEELISELMEMMEKRKLLNAFPEQENDSVKRLHITRNKNQLHFLILYPKTSSFCWNSNGQILTFQYHKIDFNQIKQSDKIISNFNDLDDWIKYCKSTDDRNNKFSKTENKLFEDDNSFVIHEKLRDLIDWKSMTDEADNEEILNSINSLESLPNLLMSNMLDDIQKEHFLNNDFNKKTINRLLLEELNLVNCSSNPTNILNMNLLSNTISFLNTDINYKKTLFENDPNDLYLIHESTPINCSQVIGMINLYFNKTIL